METLKKCLVMYICVIILGLVWMSVGHAELYPRVAVVTNINYESDIVVFTDSVGFDWEYEGVEDWCIDDVAALQLDDQGTPSIFDDKIDKVCYSAFVIAQ